MTPHEIDQRAAAAIDRIKRLSTFGLPNWEAAKIVVADAIRTAIGADMDELQRAMDAQQQEEENPRGRYLS